MNGKNIILAGVSHRWTSFAHLEKMAVSKSDLVRVMEELKTRIGLEEVCLISTCSRVEVAAVASKPDEIGARLGRWFIERTSQNALTVYRHRGLKVVHHLCRVAAGLDSWIVGESEILRQVKETYGAAFEARMTGPLLNRVFQKALGAGKAARSATGLQEGFRSIGGATAFLAKKIFGEPETGQLILFGAGQTAETVARHLAAKNFKRIIVANRSLEKARRLAQTLGGSAVSPQEGIENLIHAQVVIFSTASPSYLLPAALLREIRRKRSFPLFVVDLGMPRNVDPECASIDGVYLYDLTDLKNIVENRLESKSETIQQAETFVWEAAQKCWRELEKGASVAMANRPAVLCGP